MLMKRVYIEERQMEDSKMIAKRHKQKLPLIFDSQAT